MTAILQHTRPYGWTVDELVGECPVCRCRVGLMHDLPGVSYSVHVDDGGRPYLSLAPDDGGRVIATGTCLEPFDLLAANLQPFVEDSLRAFAE